MPVVTIQELPGGFFKNDLNNDNFRKDGRKYGPHDIINCECGDSYKFISKSSHLRAKKHTYFIKNGINNNVSINNTNINSSNMNIEKPEKPELKRNDYFNIPINPEPSNFNLSSNNNIDDFLSEFHNDNFIPTPIEDKKTKKQREKENENNDDNWMADIKQQLKEEKKDEKKQEKIYKEQKKNYDDSIKYSDELNFHDKEIYSDKPTEILGQNKRVLMAKILQYKTVFPDELKGFKIKKDPTDSELEQYLLEAEIIVNTSSVENMITDLILNVIKMMEYASSYTKKDLTGMAELLKEDKQFLQLTKLLYCKYSVFSKIPVEAQLILCIASKGVICIKKNDIKKKLENKFEQKNNIDTNIIINNSVVKQEINEEIKHDIIQGQVYEVFKFEKPSEIKEITIN